MADVAMEMATREAIWSACLGTTATAVAVELPDQVPQHLRLLRLKLFLNLFCRMCCNKHFSHICFQIRPQSPPVSTRTSIISDQISPAAVKIKSAIAQAEEVQVDE